MDLTGGALALVVFSPIMLLCAAMIKLADPKGPVLFSQVRMGFNGRVFTIYKLRTMCVDAESHGHAVRADADDPRVIGLCRWMRRSHVTELPQLINILRDEMSLAGPRPERPELFKELSRRLPNFDMRLAVKPGLTGIAQVKNGYDTDIASVSRKLAFDLQSIEQVSLGLDGRLLFSTISQFQDSSAR